MQAPVQISINFSPLKYNDSRINPRIYNFKISKPISYYTRSTIKIESLHKNRLKAGILRENMQFAGVSRGKNGIFLSRRNRVIVVKSNKGFNELGGDGGGGGKINGETTRVLGNLVVAIVLTYLTMSGQLGWLLDAVVSLWLIAVLVPIVGIGAFLWWAGRDIVQSSCPNCGNEFQIFKSAMNDDLQLCPFCTQPFSVVDDEFVSDPVMFSNQSTSTSFNQEFNNGFTPRKKKGKNPPGAVVDVEAEIRDIE